MTKRANAAYLPVAIVFGAVGIVFLATGNSIWVAFLPLAITFFALSRRADDEDGDDVAVDGGPASGDDPEDVGEARPVDRG